MARKLPQHCRQMADPPPVILREGMKSFGRPGPRPFNLWTVKL
jgi:hypothetical protein